MLASDNADNQSPTPSFIHLRQVCKVHWILLAIVFLYLFSQHLVFHKSTLRTTIIEKITGK